jgi:hypothetical protein
MALSWCSEASGWIEELTQDGSEVDYLVFTLDTPTMSMVLNDPSHRGKGGRQRLHDLFESGQYDNVVMSGAFLASAIEERNGSVVSVRKKYIHVLWVGAKVKIMLKGKVNSWSNLLRDPFPGCALYLKLLGSADLDDLAETTVEQNLLALPGQKPTRYSFTNRSLMGTMKLVEATHIDRQAEEDRIRAEEAARQLARDQRKALEAQEKAKKDAAAEAARLVAEAARLAEAERLAAMEATRLAAEEAARLAEDTKRRLEEERLAQLVLAQETARRLAADQAEANRLAEAERQRTKFRITKNATLGPGRRLVVLISSIKQTTNQRQQTWNIKSLSSK